MSGSSPKRKGDGYERELAKYFNEKVFGGDDLVQRMPLSGGGAIKSSGGSDLKNTPHIYVEAKRTEKFKIHESIKQVEENIDAANNIKITNFTTKSALKKSDIRVNSSFI